MLKRKILLLVTTAVITSFAFAASEMADMKNMPNMKMNKSDHQVMMMQEDMKTMDNKMVKALGPKNSTYDKRFIDLMIAHHEGAIMMAKDALNKSDRPEIKELSQKIIDSQEKEIQEMKAWDKSWYGQ